MRKIKFGWLSPVIGVKESQGIPIVMTQMERILPEVAKHFDSVWVPDHFYGFDERADPYLESWTTLTWLAASFPALNMGTIVLGLGYRNPALVAKMSATLQVLSNGRLILGIGAGWREEEYRAYGYPFPRIAMRVGELEEALQIIRLMWSEAAPSFKGEYFEIRAAYCPPRPSPQPLIMIGGEGEQLMIPLIARRADWWNMWWSDVNTYRRKRDLLHKHAEAAGRDPKEIVLNVARSDRPLPQSSAESSRWLEELIPMIKLGVTYFILDFGVVASTEPIARFAEEVMIPLNNLKGTS